MLDEPTKWLCCRMFDKGIETNKALRCMGGRRLPMPDNRSPQGLIEVLKEWSFFLLQSFLLRRELKDVQKKYFLSLFYNKY